MTDGAVDLSPARAPGRHLLMLLSRLELLPGAEGHAEAVAALEERRRLVEQKVAEPEGPEGPTIVGVLGGTNVGKSTIFNLTIGEWIACPSEVARGTRSAAVYTSQDSVRLLENGAFLSGYERRSLRAPSELNEAVEGPPRVFFHGHERATLAALAFVDAPDLDSNHVKNHTIARDVMFCADAVFYVTSNQKYRDAVCEDFLARAARLGKELFVVFNFSTPRAVEDFRERFQLLTGARLAEQRLICIPYSKGAELGGGPWRGRLVGWLEEIAAAGDSYRARARRGAALSLPAELAPCLDRYRREVEVVEDLRRGLGRAAKRRAREYSNEARQGGIPEMDEILTLVMKELSVPGIDRIYDAIFDSARSIWTRLRSLFGTPESERVRVAREQGEAHRLSRHHNAFIDDVREVFDDCDPGFREALWRFVPEGCLRSLDEPGAVELAAAWRAARRDIIEIARDKILDDLKDKRALKTFIRAGKILLRSASVVAVFHIGPQPLLDLGGSAVIDLGLRSLLDRVFGQHYQQSTEDEVIKGLEERYEGLLSNRVLTPILGRLPESHTEQPFSQLETAIAAVRDVARAEAPLIETPL